MSCQLRPFRMPTCQELAFGHARQVDGFKIVRNVVIMKCHANHGASKFWIWLHNVRMNNKHRMSFSIFFRFFHYIWMVKNSYLKYITMTQALVRPLSEIHMTSAIGTVVYTTTSKAFFSSSDIYTFLELWWNHAINTVRYLEICWPKCWTSLWALFSLLTNTCLKGL